MTIRDEAAALAGDITELRHAIHREPEIGLLLPRTQQKILDALAGLPLEITTGKQVSSVTAVLRGGRPGPAVLLRADMDALPVTEATGLPYASQVDGAMHACGHDQHVVMPVGEGGATAGAWSPDDRLPDGGVQLGSLRAAAPAIKEDHLSVAVPARGSAFEAHRAPHLCAQRERIPSLA
jgi:hypothetical protein